MLFCFDKDLPFDYSKSEMSITKKQKNGILYDSKQDEFFNYNGEKIDISGKFIFPRTGAAQICKMNEVIKKNGGIPIISNEDLKSIYDWPKYYETNRNIRLYKGKDLLEEEKIKQIEDEYGSEIFIKTKFKNFSSIISVKLLKDKECAFYKAISCHSEEEFIISKKVTRLEDEYGVKEYRCFVVNNEIYNISRFTTNLFHKIDKKILEKLENIVETLRDKFPSFYVVDLFEYELDGLNYIDVVEFNPIQASGLYLYNSCIEKSDDLLHQNKRKISSEFLNVISNCSDYGNVVSADGNMNNLYDIHGSFAFDLRSICLTGNPGNFSFDTKLSIKDFERHKPLFTFENIMDDEYFEKNDEDVLAQIEDLQTIILDESSSLEEKIKKLLKENKD